MRPLGTSGAVLTVHGRELDLDDLMLAVVAGPCPTAVGGEIAQTYPQRFGGESKVRHCRKGLRL